MNRKRTYRHPASTSSWATALYSSQVFTEQKADEIMNTVDTALQLLVDGKADDKHFTTVAVAVNMAAMRVEQIGGEIREALEILDAAGDALRECKRIKDTHGRYGLTGPGRGQIAAAVHAYEAILRASSPRQMHLAEEELGRRLRQQERATA